MAHMLPPKTAAEVLKEAGCRYDKYRFYYAAHLWCLVSNALELIRVSKVLDKAGVPAPKSHLGYLIFSSSKVWREQQIQAWEDVINGSSAEWKTTAHAWDVRKLPEKVS